MKKLDLTRQDIFLLFLFFISLPLLITGIEFKSLIAVLGVTGLILAWFLSIDTIIANHNMNLIKSILFGGIIVMLPLLFMVYKNS